MKIARPELAGIVWSIWKIVRPPSKFHQRSSYWINLQTMGKWLFTLIFIHSIQISVHDLNSTNLRHSFADTIRDANFTSFSTWSPSIQQNHSKERYLQVAGRKPQMPTISNNKPDGFHLHVANRHKKCAAGWAATVPASFPADSCRFKFPIEEEHPLTLVRPVLAIFVSVSNLPTFQQQSVLARWRKQTNRN